MSRPPNQPTSNGDRAIDVGGDFDEEDGAARVEQQGEVASRVRVEYGAAGGHERHTEAHGDQLQSHTLVLGEA